MRVRRATETATVLPPFQRMPAGRLNLALLALVASMAWMETTSAFAADSGSEADRAPSQQFVVHTIVGGDTLFVLAKRYGSTVELLVDTNAITDVRKLRIGALLRVPLIQPAPPPSLPARPLAPENSNRIKIERFIERSENQLRGARFEAALESANAARALLDAQPAPSQSASRVRIEVVSATAAVALGDNAAARSSMERALHADPDLTLDPAVVSPKVLRVLRAARQREF